MSISVTDQYAKPAIHAVGLTVEQSGMTVTVKAGSFKMVGVDYTLTEDQDFVTTADPTDDTLVTGYLAKEESSGDPVLIVDEEVLSGNDVPFIFRGSGYELLHVLYRLKVPAAATDLDAVDITVFHMVENEMPEDVTETTESNPIPDPGGAQDPVRQPPQ